MRIESNTETRGLFANAQGERLLELGSHHSGTEARVSTFGIGRFIQQTLPPRMLLMLLPNPSIKTR